VRAGGVWLGLCAGALCAIAIACGGSAKSAMAPGQTTAMPRAEIAEIDALSRQIDADLAALGLARPAAPAGACIRPPCGAEALSVAPRPAHTEEPSCRPGAGETCRDTCRLSDSICDSAGRICRIAADLGGDDAYANERCAGGKASCDASRTRCCGCQ
jgi:hypothetical protein